jgi:hypothetical protein
MCLRVSTKLVSTFFRSEPRDRQQTWANPAATGENFRLEVHDQVFCEPPANEERHYNPAMKYLMEERVEGDTEDHGAGLTTLVVIMNLLRSPAYDKKAIDVLFFFNERFCSPPASEEVLLQTHADYLRADGASDAQQGERTSGKGRKRSQATKLVEMAKDGLLHDPRGLIPPRHISRPGNQSLARSADGRRQTCPAAPSSLSPQGDEAGHSGWFAGETVRSASCRTAVMKGERSGPRWCSFSMSVHGGRFWLVVARVLPTQNVEEPSGTNRQVEVQVAARRERSLTRFRDRGPACGWR